MSIIDKVNVLRSTLMNHPYKNTERNNDEWTAVWLRDGSELGLCCPICKKSFGEYVACIDYIFLAEVPNYCPNCGTKLEGP